MLTGATLVEFRKPFTNYTTRKWCHHVNAASCLEWGSQFFKKVVSIEIMALNSDDTSKKQ
jgi:hypothetical protein